MKLLLVADEEDRSLWDHYTPDRLGGADLILSAGDLNPLYLSFLVTMANRPLLYVHGNHDGVYDTVPPEGCECADDRLVTVNGLRVLGLGGCMRYNDGPHQYTEAQMRRRIQRLQWALLRAGGADIVLTHAPLRGCGDGADLPHRGFSAFLPLLDRWQPRYLIHGHMHTRYDPLSIRVRQYGGTTIINACGRFLLDTDAPPTAG